jgi:hypothetical protein
MSSYDIVPTMNTMSDLQISTSTALIRQAYNLGTTVLFVRKTSELVDPGPVARMVFLDLGWGWGSVPWGSGLGSGWGGDQPPPIFHSNGTCMSFADGHGEYWKWQNPETVQFAEACMDWHWNQYMNGPTGPAAPRFPGGQSVNEDYLRLQRAIWGKGPVSVREK